MDPWSFQLTGSKSRILKDLEKTDAPECAKQAVVALMEPMAEVPGFTHEDPADTWAREVPHTSADVPPRRLNERIKTRWLLDCGGHPDAFGVSQIRIEGIYEVK
jgi:hypothetical protein